MSFELLATLTLISVYLFKCDIYDLRVQTCDAITVRVGDGEKKPHACHSTFVNHE